MAIDIGADAIERAFLFNRNACFIEGSNPASVAGTIRKVYIYVSVPIRATVGILYKTNGDTFTSRDYEDVGNLTVGLNEKNVILDVEVGDYIGIALDGPTSSTSGLYVDFDAGWTNDYWTSATGDVFPFTGYTFSNIGKRIISLYGELGGTATVTTQAVTSISGTTATGNGNVTDLGDTSVTQHGHCWDTSETPTTTDSGSGKWGKTSLGAKAATGAFTSSLTGLTAGTLYYVRAYVTNSDGTSYGGEVNFTAGAQGAGGELAGLYAVVEERFHYVDAYGVERYIQGEAV